MRADLLARACCLGAALACLSCTAGPAQPAGSIVIEAEHYGHLVPGMRLVREPGASGGQVLQTPQERLVETPPDRGYAAYRLRLPQAATYRLWARCWWASPYCSPPALLVSVDGGAPVAIGPTGTYERWHWVRGPATALTAGEHVFAFRSRAGAAKLDQFLLVKGSRYVPVGSMVETPGYLVRPPSIH